MRPIDFVVYDGDSTPNEPVYKLAEALQQPIRIVSVGQVWMVRSYYMYNGQMVLEITESKNET
jgi:hypothetical protein